MGRRGRGLRGPLGGYHPRRLRPVPPARRQAPRPAQGRARGSGCGAGLHPTGVCRVVRGAAGPRSTAATPAAPPRGERRPRSGVARDQRARGGVAAAPQGAGRVSNALTQVCGHWAALPVRPPGSSLPPPFLCPRPLPRPPPPQPGEQRSVAGGDTDPPPPGRRVDAPPAAPRQRGGGGPKWRGDPPPHPPGPPPPPGGERRLASSPHPPPRLTRGTAASLPPPARGGGWVRTACMAGRYAESSGQPSSAPRAACEPQDRPSNQIKSNLPPLPPPHPPYPPPTPYPYTPQTLEHTDTAETRVQVGLRAIGRLIGRSASRSGLNTASVRMNTGGGSTASGRYRDLRVCLLRVGQGVYCLCVFSQRSRRYGALFGHSASQAGLASTHGSPNTAVPALRCPSWAFGEPSWTCNTPLTTHHSSPGVTVSILGIRRAKLDVLHATDHPSQQSRRYGVHLGHSASQAGRATRH